jgi:hypothetical protein
MAMFESVAKEQLKVLFTVFLLGNPFRAVPTNPATACGWDLYARVVLAQHFLALVAFTAFILLVTVMSELRVAEAVAAYAGAARAFDADLEGLGSVAGRWRRRWLRGSLLAAVALSFAASVLAVVAFQDGFRYRTGCRADIAGHGSGSPMGVLMMGLFALVHGVFAWVAATKN